MDDVYFDPRCAIVSGDQKLEFVNEGKSLHSFTVPELDFDVLSGKTKTTKQPIGKVLKPGDSYAYVCKYHQHMKLSSGFSRERGVLTDQHVVFHALRYPAGDSTFVNKRPKIEPRAGDET